ncbi:hypothetical protein HDA32_002705 [Spinactinospora alkalitolerans]|uniref:DUF4360 domain-containing protein n=1 Tax=Spinactinospora alkalitolerans TaxID=687207 RepID=A0A852TW16_9ACTN|nr:DUF4360 domain-containing protein [Spinactinospora alkalitolerans]NYE47585.1 hypothetical protein [Spinactinospora alkalitolerans]
MFKAISAAAASLFAASALLAAPASAETIVIPPPPPGGITIDLVTINGSGCAPGTAAVSVAPDNTAFTVTYSEYLAQAGGNSSPIDSRKNCQLAVRVNVPQGYTYAIARADYRGYADLADGATGTQKASYYFQGMEQTIPVMHELNGPHANNWQFSDEAGLYVYAPCDAIRNFNINTELRVDAGDSDETSFMTMDSTDGSISTTYQFSWKQCDE